MHILLVEDDAPLAATTARALQSQGWHVDTTARGEPVPLSLQRDRYDLLILDVGLAGIDGFETLRRVRDQGSRLPVLMLTARDAIEDRVRGLEGGADDYLIKPFALRELVARAWALVRRSESRQGDLLSLGRLRLDMDAQRAFVDEEPLNLSSRELTVLQYLLLRAGKVVAREQIVAMIPGWDASKSDNALDILVSRLRAKIEPGALRLRTVRGLGYLLEEAPKPS
jgi:DNA-binding response OmpR family regulator